jgi:hypothetical protein
MGVSKPPWENDFYVMSHKPIAAGSSRQQDFLSNILVCPASRFVSRILDDVGANSPVQGNGGTLIGLSSWHSLKKQRFAIFVLARVFVRYH